ncbi:tRNA uridine-5-carboxymethylaminomethyl(34) synthesis enzyme MnmG [Magnetococcus sp. PR-3]|uniref:tRNA uridine-5-carboxymethylaminomethyl(34) synthesis enzyme MnmG n=1 Tax=Magnetococcus sp. PR-3 TaxID=3120355 RepID=UPI002FCE3108
MFDQTYEVIVVGAGHAGCEAANAAASLGCRTLLCTQSIDAIGQMSCNPAIGGIGKGHLVKELDALGGLMGVVADKSGIQFKKLNRRKGPAVHGSRAQMDKADYRKNMKHELDVVGGLELRQCEVVDIIFDGKCVVGVKTDWGELYGCRSVVLASGTFLDGLIHIGDRQFPSGRLGDKESHPLAVSMKSLNLEMARFKTGTPPRLDARTIDVEALQRQDGDVSPSPFSFIHDKVCRPHVSCWIGNTTKRTKQIIQNNLHRSAMYSGQIEGVGPRYCPSIEDKIKKFEGRDTHQVFLEPEGVSTNEVYVNGISTSMPVDVQWEMVRSIEGLSGAQIVRPGYAIEYDMVMPTELDHSLAVKTYDGLYLAGQINGTTGYEEAAVQGLVAGLNAARTSLGKEKFRFERESGYVGLLVDDLVTRGVDEPYRMFTSRSELRILHREDNADFRLTELGRELGLVGGGRWSRHQEKIKQYASLQNMVKRIKFGGGVVEDYLKRTDCDLSVVADVLQVDAASSGVLEVLKNDVVYRGYESKIKSEMDRVERYKEYRIPGDMDWSKVPSLSNEVRARLVGSGCRTVSDVVNTKGVTPASVVNVLIYLGLR